MIHLASLRIASALFFLSAAATRAEAPKLFDFPGKYQGRSAQGMAIHEDTAFLLNDHGHCRVYHLPTQKLLGEFPLASAGAHNHANCASFGAEFPEGNDQFPAIYVAQCRADRFCYVESVGNDGSKLIQTIKAETGTKADKNYDWVVDREQKFIYTLAHQESNFDKNGTNRVLITRFPLPSLKEREVTFKKSDILDEFTVEFANLAQGAVIRGGRLYLPVGLHEAAKEGAPHYKSREVIVVNLESKMIEKRIDVNADIKDEPEDAAFHGDRLLMFVGQAGGLYHIKGF
jgi:hypothetical protein